MIVTVLGSKVFNQVFQKLGSWTQFRIGSTAVNSRGDETNTWTTVSGEGYVQVINDNNELVQGGILRLGDAVGYFRHDSPLPAGSKAQVGHQGVWFNLFSEPTIPTFSGNQLIRKVLLRRDQP